MTDNLIIVKITLIYLPDLIWKKSKRKIENRGVKLACLSEHPYNAVIPERDLVLLKQYQHHTNERIETVRKLGTVHFFYSYSLCVIEKSIDIIPFPNPQNFLTVHSPLLKHNAIARYLIDRWGSQKRAYRNVA